MYGQDPHRIAMQRLDSETETLLPMRGGSFDDAHSLKADGFDGNAGSVQANKVQAVAHTLRENQRNNSDPISEAAMHVLEGMDVRRLTPVECERLQGFPLTRDIVRLDICLDRPNNSVGVVPSCLRLLDSASPAAASASRASAKSAERPSGSSPASPEWLAALHVRTDSVDELLAIRNHGRLIWSVGSADVSSASLPLTQTESIARDLAPLGRELAREITAGKAESLPSIRLSMPEVPGERSAPRSGGENGESVSGASNAASLERFTTALLGQLTPTSDSPTAISLCSVLAVIGGCIPSETLPETFSLELTVDTPYTLVPYRKKSAADGPRYKALGNSMAVNCMRWIGLRIAAVERITVQTEAGAA